MSERFQKTFISVREFVESWDKELYELTNLDLFIYLLINHIGNQLEKRFFIQNRQESPLYLNFDHIGTVCFNLGDTFEYFLEENCLGNCPLNCPRDLSGKIDLEKNKLEDRIKNKITLLQSFMAGQLDKEQCLRIDLMNHVILDTLIQFYSDEFQVELDEEDISLIELAEFIEDIIIDFIRLEGKTLLQKPFETALDYFENLLQNESDETSQNQWYEEQSSWEPKDKEQLEDWQKQSETIDEVFSKFISDDRYNPGDGGGAITHDLSYFKKYLVDNAELENIYQLNEHHIGEFFSIWLVREFIMGDETQLNYIFRVTARFITYLYHHYNLNLKKEFLKIYDSLKLDLPRLIKSTNTYISEYDLLNAILTEEEDEYQRKIGFFEIIETYDKSSKLMDLRDLHFLNHLNQIKLNSAAFLKLRKGDILHANIVKKNNHWEIVDIQFIYPNIAKRYLNN